MRRNIPPETVALLRRRYADGVPLAAIQAETRVRSIDTFYKCLDGHYDDGSGAPLPLPRIPRRRVTVRRATNAPRRLALVARIWRSAEQQVGQIEKRLAKSGLATDERDARSLAILVRTLRELAAFEERRGETAKQLKADDDDSAPRDLDELRRELARKMDALIESRTPNR